MGAHAIIVAAGSGTRTGLNQPKQWMPLFGRPLIDWSVSALSRNRRFDRVVLVVHPDWHDQAKSRFPDVTIVPGGTTRTDSVRSGLAATSCAPQDLVFVHDAARPGLTVAVIEHLFAALKDFDGAAPALPVVDALKHHGDAITSVDRSALYRIQTPQAFVAKTLSAALDTSASGLVDDFEAAQAIGARLTLVEGDEKLMKVTYAQDFDRVARLLAPSPGAWRTGTGFDVHGFAPGEHVTLCGVKIAHSAGLKGHSDADVGWHALTDAILGAAALGDIGDHFPPSDARWKDADSEVFLRHAIVLARDAGFALSHCDITLICERPKVKPHREAMRQRTADVTGLDIGAVSVKATTTEGLGFTGRGEGIAAMASATLVNSGEPDVTG